MSIDNFFDILLNMSAGAVCYRLVDNRVELPENEINNRFYSVTGISPDDSFIKWLTDNALRCDNGKCLRTDYFDCLTSRWFNVETGVSGDSFVSIFSDITKNKNFEEQFSALIDATPDMICFKNGDGGWVMANKTMLNVFDLADKDYAGKTDAELAEMSPENMRHVFETCLVSDEQTWLSKEVTFMEEQVPNAKGGITTFEVIKSPVFYDNEKTKRKALVMLGRDVTERKRYVQQISRQAAFLNSLLNSIPDLIFYKDINGIYLLCNPAFASFTGLSMKQLFGKTDYHIFSKDVADEFIRNDKEMLTLKASRQNNEWVTYPDGRKRLLSTLKTPYYDEKGEVIGILGISRDITELHMKNVELQNLNDGLNEKIKAEVEKNRQYEQMFYSQRKLADMGRLMSSISHHWRQPLNAIGLYIQDLCDGYYDKTLDDLYINNFERQTLYLINSLSDTIDNFKNFFKPSNTKESFEIVSDIYELLKICHAEFVRHNITIRFKCLCDSGDYVSEDLAKTPQCTCACTKITSYKDEFNQVMLNIIQNAIDASINAINTGIIDKGLVEVGVCIDNDIIKIHIFNAGSPISDDIGEKIFDPYFTTKGDGSGTGIGLFNAKIVLETYMQGLITYENKPEGVDFIVTLPVSNTL